MQDLAATWEPTRVEVRGRAYCVPRPSVRQAISVQAALQGAAQGDRTAWRALRRTCAGWLPPTLCSSLFARMTPPQRTASFLQKLLERGVPEEHAEKKEALEEEAQKRSWLEIVTDFVACYEGHTFGDVLDMDWPLFVAAAGEEERVRAMQMQTQATASAAGFGSAEAWDVISEQAKYQQATRQDGAALLPESKLEDDDFYQKQLDNARHLREGGIGFG